MIRRLPVSATLVVLAAVAIMLRLGFWQLERKAEKEALIARYEASLVHGGVSLVQAHRPEAAYRTIRDYCENPGPPAAVSGRNAQGESGWVLVVRCSMGGRPPNDETGVKYVPYPVDVVMGWSRKPTSNPWSGGLVTGTVVPSGKLGYKVLADPPLAGLAANARPDPRDIPNDHLSYALQWFFFATAALMIYGLALRKRLAQGAAPR